MKLYELTPNDTFSMEIYNSVTDELELTITGVFIKTDGMYCQVQLDGVPEIQYLLATSEITKTS